ncbi:MAG: NAD(P)/FAD-dependent oxidoreductase [Devosia sp.]|nr:NAD(P)/FAD-dependent oxidoreductase [Devosia sp.]
MDVISMQGNAHEEARALATGHEDRLGQLEHRVRRDLEMIEAPLRAWVPESRAPDGRVIPDIIIVGAGLSGLSVAFGLKRQGVDRVMLIDAADENNEGPWVTTARMRTLRSPKTLTGPDLGIPSLTYRSWHEASYGETSWTALDKIDRRDWMDYLGWFRRVTGLNVQNRTRLLAIDAHGALPVLTVERAGRTETLTCRELVLATGLEGAGYLSVPKIVTDNVPRERWAHSGEPFDLAVLEGADVGVIGSAASSFDWAVSALRAGAKAVTLLARSTTMPRTEILDWSNFPGFLNHFADLDETRRYRFARRLLGFKTPPTQEMYDAARRFPNFRMVLGAALDAVSFDGSRVRIATGSTGDFAFNYLLLGTGYEVDLSRRPELAGIASNIALWGDRFTPPEGEADPGLLRYPYLGPAFECLEKYPGTMPALRHVHIFNNGAIPSLGPVCNGITGLKAGAPKMVASLTRVIFRDDADQHYGTLCGYEKQHFDPFSVPS